MYPRDIIATLKGAVNCVVKRHTGPFKKLYREIQETQWLGEKELEVYQLTRLRRIIRHAWESVPYYRQLMQERQIRLEDITTLSDIGKFPIMCKEDLKTIGDDIVSMKYPKFLLRTAHTGGTTGLPVPMKRDIWSIAREHAFVRRQFDWARVEISDRCAYLEGRVVVPPGKSSSRLYYYDGVMKELTLSTFHLTPEVVGDYVRAIKSHKVKAILAYPSAAFVLAKGCLDENIRVPLRCVLTTSETLDDGKKRVISDAFGCAVFDFYGSAERVCYIHTCEKGTYHLIPEYGLTELIPAEPPNEDCYRIVATGFWNMAMPLIRYNIGDLVKVSGRKCSCDRAFPVVDKIIGRDGNIITTPSGVQLGASVIECMLAHVLYPMYEMPVLAGQVIQESPDRVILEYVPADSFSQKDANKLRKLLREEVPEEIEVDVCSVDKIRQTPSGKYLSFVMGEHH